MQREAVRFCTEGGVLHAAVLCELDHYTARAVRQRIDRELFAGRPRILVLDFSAVRFMDSSGIALILGRAEAAEAVGAVVKLQGLSDALMKLVRLSGLERVKNLTVTPSGR
ncbi:MAG: STAS domain-containing protein [Clostridia bacterium]|nr:STAS domain-containing protein [Clostridia bacterium]